MDSLPAELIELILLWDVRMCRCDKNSILALRLVCRAFDAVLRPYTCKTMQLEFSKFLRDADTPNIGAMAAMGDLCQALYLDMMVVRDEEEITRLSSVFREIIPKVPEMVPLLESLRRYCMNESTFDETDFRRMLEDVLEATPNLTRLKLNLPFQVVGRTSSTATLLLATTFACFAKRPEESKPIETLVLDHVSDTTLLTICNNPIDLGNALATFAGLKNLVISIKRQESRNSRQISFTQQLWFLIRKAVGLESLCIIGWNVKRDMNTRKHRHSVSFNEWNMRSLPYPIDPMFGFPKLRFLELKRVDINPHYLVTMIEDNAQTLKEVYLNEVYIKVFGSSEQEDTALWIGHPDITRPEQCTWVADDLRKARRGALKLDVLRVTGLGYDDYEPDGSSAHPDYDLVDPTGLDRSFDQRFVQAVFETDDMVIVDAPPITPEWQHFGQGKLPAHSESATSLPPIAALLSQPSWISSPENIALPPLSCVQSANDYDAETYQRHRNTTSHFKRCIDGYFFNHNEQALKELQKIITVADRGMSMISAEIDSSHHIIVNPDGNLEQH